MSCRRAFALLSCLCLGALASADAASAVAAPVWNLDMHHNQTNFAPGGTAEYWLDIANVGDTASSGTITVTVSLPSGITGAAVIAGVDRTTNFEWSCPGAAGSATIVCTSGASIESHRDYRGLRVAVEIGAGASGDPVASAKVEGGGAARAATTLEPAHISAEPAGFGVVASSFTPGFFAADGTTPVVESGAHPALASFPFDFNTIDDPTHDAASQKIANGRVRDVEVDLPPGFLGNPTAVGECTQAQFTISACPPSSQVGRVDLRLYPITSLEEQTFTVYTTGVFNLSHPRGSIADLAFAVFGNPVHVKVSLDAANRYAIRSAVTQINETIAAFGQRLTLWGVPADSSHDSERCELFSAPLSNGDTSEECGTDAPRAPFLTVPSQCEVDHVMRLSHYDSWEDPGNFGNEIDYTLPQRTTNCDHPRFEPEVEIEPTGTQANTPTGLNVHVKIAQNENRNALATPPVKRFTVTLPEGMSFSPSFADGLQSCTLAQMKLGTNEPIECPDASRIGEVTLHTPLLPKAAEGSMYLAAQNDNPFGSLFALYLVLHDTEERGALIKIPGRIDVDPTTGRIVAVFDELPQFPFDDMTLKFRSGPRAPLVSPPSCGTQTIGVVVASYAQPNDPVNASNTYQVTEGPNGTPCPADPAGRPFAPKMTSGTLNPVAGSYSPLLFRLSREDSEQELGRLDAILPPGLVAKIAGVDPCPDSALASISEEAGTGAAQLEHPACPANSQIGTISAGLGAGPGPNYFPGKVYLAGPYKGAPLSLAIVVPALAGPFDLGTQVVRVGVQIDRETARVTAVSDPLPTILHGVILRVRDVRMRVDRPDTMLNPTNCSPMEIGAHVFGLSGGLFDASNPFQVGSCASLAFKPRLGFRLFGGTRRGAHPKLRATLAYPRGGGYANIAGASVALPRSEFLDQGHIGTVCTRVQFAAANCPPASVYGWARAVTPLFSTPLEGPVYLRSSDNPLPDVVAALKGPASQPIEVDLDGRVDSVRGGIRNSFEVVPDAPVERFTLVLKGGKKGLLVNSTNLCKGKHRATAVFSAQNGRRVTLRPALRNSCKASRKAKRRRHRRR